MKTPTNHFKSTATAWNGSTHDLSDQIYEILDNDHPSFKIGYGKGDLVRLIRLRNEGDRKFEIGEHSFAEDMVVVSSLTADCANFCGIKKESLREV